jgi:TolB-like protein
MRKSFVVVILTGLLLLVISSAVLANGNPAKKIGVLTLKNDSQYTQFGSIAAETITADLTKLKSCIVVERNELSRVFAEQSLGAKGYINEASVTELGGILGLNYLLMGSVDGDSVKEPGHNYYNKKRNRNEWVEGTKKTSVVLTLKLIDVQNGQIVWSDQTAVTNYDDDINGALAEAAYDSVRKIYKFIPLQGYIIKSEASQYVIDLGTNHNVTVGDIFEVNSASSTMRHPVTGELIVMKRNAGELEVTEVFDSLCIAKVKDSEDAKVKKDIQPGDAAVKKLKKKQRGFLGLGWSGKHDF